MMQALDAAPAGFSHVPHRYGPYSASKLIVARCPARFQGKYVLKDRIIADSLNASRGSAIHFVLEQIDLARIAAQEITPVQLNQWVERALGMYPAAYDQVKLVKDAATTYISNPPKYLGQKTNCEQELGIALYEEESFVDDVVPPRAYVKIPYSLEGEGHHHTRQNPEAYFGGKLDKVFVDEQLKIVIVMDHKSTPNASENSDNTFQMGCYAFLASLFYPGYTIKSVIHFAHPDLNFYAPPVEWDSTDLSEVEDEIRMRIRAIESFEEYPALPGGHCGYCHMVQQCPEYLALEQQNARGGINLNMNSLGDAVRIARQLKVTSDLYDSLNKTLKDGLEKLNLPGVAIEGYMYGFKPTSMSVDWDATEQKIAEEVRRARMTLEQKPDDPYAKRLVEMGDLAGMLEKYGIDAQKFKNWRNEKLKALWKTDKPELLKLLGSFAVYDRGTRFSGYKL